MLLHRHAAQEQCHHDYHVYTEVGSVHRQGMHHIRWALIENGSAFLDMYPKLTLKQCKEEDGCHVQSYTCTLVWNSPHLTVRLQLVG